MDALEVVLMGEFVELVIPVCSILAGFTLATALLENCGARHSARECVVALLSVSSVSFVCAVCASALYLHRLGMVKAGLGLFEGSASELGTTTLEKALNEMVKDGGVGFVTLFQISGYALTLGVGGVLGAIAFSGFMRGPIHGVVTTTAALLGSCVLIVSVTLPF